MKQTLNFAGERIGASFGRERTRGDAVLGDDGSFGQVVAGDGAALTVLWIRGRRPGYGTLRRNPVTREWWALDRAGAPLVHAKADQRYKVGACRSLRFAFPIVSRNGCSSLVKTALAADGVLAAEDPRFVWATPFFGHAVLPPSRGCVLDGEPSSYRRFVVVDDERRRTFRWVDHVLRNGLCPYLRRPGELSREDHLREALWAGPILFSDPWANDQHAIPQKLYLKRLERYALKGGAALDSFERVPLENLADWFAESFGTPLVRNNVTPADRRIFGNPTDAELALVDDYVSGLEARGLA